MSSVGIGSPKQVAPVSSFHTTNIEAVQTRFAANLKNFNSGKLSMEGFEKAFLATVTNLKSSIRGPSVNGTMIDLASRVQQKDGKAHADDINAMTNKVITQVAEFDPSKPAGWSAGVRTSVDKYLKDKTPSALKAKVGNSAVGRLLFGTAKSTADDRTRLTAARTAAFAPAPAMELVDIERA